MTSRYSEQGREIEHDLLSSADLLGIDTLLISRMYNARLFPRAHDRMIPSGDLSPYMRMTRQEIEELV